MTLLLQVLFFVDTVTTSDHACWGLYPCYSNKITLIACPFRPWVQAKWLVAKSPTVIHSHPFSLVSTLMDTDCGNPILPLSETTSTFAWLILSCSFPITVSIRGVDNDAESDSRRASWLWLEGAWSTATHPSKCPGHNIPPSNHETQASLSG